MKKEWFAEWFDSPYYHILYKNRDENEAKTALDNLLSAMDLPVGARMLDLACGKGRHSKYLAEKGFDVTGLDISMASIAFARQFEHEHLMFYQHDMRLPFRMHYYDAVMNMFTSFGYFKTDADHLKTLVNVSKGLRKNGLFLLDFFNAQWVRDNLVAQAEKTVDGITFQLHKSVRKGYVYKTVDFQTGGRHFEFREKVRLFDLQDFQNLFEQAGLELVKTFGSYALESYNPQISKRLILLARKKPT